jgi:hypothetical protein
VVTEGNTGLTVSHAADLVIDSTGRGSRTPQWLKALGYGEIEESEVRINVGYTTRMYKRDPADPRGETWIVYSPEAPAENALVELSQSRAIDGSLPSVVGTVTTHQLKT